MPSFLDPLPCYKLPLAVFSELHRLILDKGTQTEAFVITDARVVAAKLAQTDVQRFVLSISSSMQVLLVGQLPQTSSLSGDRRCQVGLTFEPVAIANFLNQLGELVPDDEALQERLRLARPLLQSGLNQDYGDLALQLLQQAVAIAPSIDTPTAQPHVCQPVQAALDQQLEKSLLLNQVVNKIRQSLELPVILETTVAQVRRFLQSDRLVIYQFENAASEAVENLTLMPAAPLAAASTSEARRSGLVTYESRISEQLPSVINQSEADCFHDWPSSSHQQYEQGIPTVVNDVQKTYQASPCLLAFLEKIQVKSKLIAPILVRGKLWGLLIAHQCRETRYWQPWEVEFLQHIAAHLAVAISQAQLYQQLQQQKRTLEARVVERTQNLHDALIAAQSASRAKSEFLATMSHELRTPLTCIIGMSATLLRWSIGDLSPRQRSYLDTIHASGAHLLSVINDILEVSKIESGRMALDISEFSLSSLVRQSLEGFQEQAQQKQIQLISDLKIPASQDLFMADPRRLKQILQNLLSNAIKFTPVEGSVKLRLRFEQQAAVFQVEDTGIGIPDSQHALLFEKFQQLENTRHRQYQGTGLGLALTKQLVDLHGGSISVQSRVGSGSIFTVRLPRQVPRSSKAELAQQLSHSSEPVTGRVVLVEEQEEVASVICDMLTAADYQVIWLVDGSQVVEQIDLLQPRAVIINLQLTSANGQQIINSLRRYTAAHHTRILAITADPGLETTVIPQTGIDQMIVQPIDPEKLLATVNALMSQTTAKPLTDA
ncbi:MAG: GAF domain-containing protein [Leptolyngbya sp. SIO4C5]|nr:GAF domain-containing protein [Leptolyngbya sp. SIO4C5]